MINDRKDKDFTRKTITTLAERSHFLCNRPNCRKMTTGPHSDINKSLRSGEAAHIYSAKSKTARYNCNLNDGQIQDIKNGIWLCRDCHKLIDSDENEFPAKILFQWKKTHEKFVIALRSNSTSGTLQLIKPTIDEELKANEVLNYLDDRRALHKDFQYEIPAHVYLSLQETRRELLKKKNDVPSTYLAQEIDKTLKAIREFMDTIYDIDVNNISHNQNDPEWIKFENSLSILRKIIGVIVLEIAEKFSLTLGSDLQKISPV